MRVIAEFQRLKDKKLKWFMRAQILSCDLGRGARPLGSSWPNLYVSVEHEIDPVWSNYSNVLGK